MIKSCVFEWKFHVNLMRGTADCGVSLKIMRKLGGGELTGKESAQRLALSLWRNVNTEAAKLGWKTRVKRVIAVEYTNWLNNLQQQAAVETRERLKLNLNRYFMRKGAGTAYLMSMKERSGAIRSITHTNSTLARKLKVPMRRLKAGLICNLLILEHMFNQKWGRYTFGERADRIMCPCGMGVQDVRHLITECTAVSGIIERTGEKLVIVAKRVSDACAESLERMSTSRRVVTVLHMTWAGRTSDRQRRMVRDCAEVMSELLDALEGRLKDDAVTWEEP